MAKELKITAISKEEQYIQLIPQIKALLSDENDAISNMANVCAALKFGMSFFWVGFYLVKENQLVLGPFQGPVACTRIDFGKGVCGSAWQKKQVIIVPDVEQFSGHISCNSLSKSEIVIPLIDSNKKVIGVLDVDSDKLNNFDKIDERYLIEILSYLVI